MDEQDNNKTQTANKIIYLLVFLSWVIYVFVTFTTPEVATNNEAFKLTNFQVLAVRLSICIMYLFMWMGGIYGAMSLRTTSFKGITKVGTGLSEVLAAFIVPAVLGAVSTAYVKNETMQLALVILNNYIYVFLPLIGFLTIYRGLNDIWLLQTDTPKTRDDGIITAIFLVLVSTVYTYLVFTNENRQSSVISGVLPTYYLPDIMIVLTIIVPSIVSWGLGVYSTLLAGRISSMNLLGEQIKESRLVKGLWFVIFSSILLQIILSLGNVRFASLGIATLLALVYVFLGFQLLGFMFVALSIRRERKDSA